MKRAATSTSPPHHQEDSNKKTTNTESDPLIAETPTPPYYAVIFTSLRATTNNDTNNSNSRDANTTTKNDNDNDSNQLDYATTAKRMVELAKQQPGYLGVESPARDEQNGLGITVSYWKDLDSIKKWKQNWEHVRAQEMGQKQWYTAYTTRIALVERDYSL